MLYAIAHDTGSLVATLLACVNGPQGGASGEEWFKAARQALKVGQSEAETLYYQACDAVRAQGRQLENNCHFLA